MTLADSLRLVIAHKDSLFHAMGVPQAGRIQWNDTFGQTR